jgi:hypothetical protein
MAAYLAKTGTAVSDDHRPDLLKQRLDGGGMTSGGPDGQVAKAGRLTRRYSMICR